MAGGDTLERFDIEVMASHGTHIFIGYTAKWPAKPTFRNIELIMVADGLISAVEAFNLAGKRRIRASG